MSRKRSKKRKNNKKIIFILISILLIVAIILICYKINDDRTTALNQNKLKQDIMNHYNEYVMTNTESEIYQLNDNKYISVGKIGKNQELTLDAQEITHDDIYLKVKTFEEEYYIHYKNLDVIEQLSTTNQRYKKYIVFNKNVITKNQTNFYDEEDNLVYSLNSSFDLPIIVNKETVYGVEFNNRLLYVKKEDVEEIKDSNNTDKKNTSGVAVLNYHFFYDETQASERKDCNQLICKSKSGFIQHLEYIKNNNIFTLTMKEFEMYLNKEINLPKSTLITIDDGWRIQIGTELLQKYQLNGTVFLITSWFEEIKFLNDLEYIEYHSHGDNLHNQGDCPGAQGGAITCKDKATLLKDLSLSRKKLGGTTAFCYPFYEYNNYSKSVLQEAGFTLAFIGGMRKATPNTDKYKIPRYVIYDSTTVNQIKSYIG